MKKIFQKANDHYYVLLPLLEFGYSTADHEWYIGVEWLDYTLTITF